MPEDPTDPPPPPPLFPILAAIIGVDLVIIGMLSFTGALQRLSPTAQFLYGLTTFAFPVIVYVLLKRRRGE
jgi:drug/metabolite transporter (DMT)-like permease